MDNSDIEAAMVRLLQGDGRMSVKELAAQLGLPRAAASRALREMLASGTVRVGAATDPRVAGYRFFLHALVAVDGPVEAVARSLRDLPETVFVASLAGSHGLAFEARCASEAEKAATLARVRAIPAVRRVRTTSYTEILKGPFAAAVAGPEVALDAIDRALIAALEADGRATYEALAHAADTSVSTARERVSRLLRAKVIRISAVERRGVRNTQLGMGVGIVGHDGCGELASYVRGSRYVEFAAAAYGQFDFIVTVVAPTPAELHGVLEDLRRLVPGGEVDAWMQLSMVKESYASAPRTAMRLGVAGSGVDAAHGATSASGGVSGVSAASGD